MNIKRARYIRKNIELNQEFHFAAPKTKININNIYNSSFFGSVLWDVFSPDAEKIESSWNRSMKIMLDLPYETHRGLIEPLSDCEHIKRLFLKRFLQFISKLSTSKKPILQTLLSAIQADSTSTTGRNLRSIMLLCDKCSIDDISIDDINNFPYFPRPDDDNWKCEMLQHMLDEKCFRTLDDDEIQWMNYLASH